MTEVKYPVGEQSFERLREGGFLYIDKTQFIEPIINGSKYFFLGRPRRFGKSIFLSTLKCFFEGKRHLFKGLYADNLDWKWETYPVLYLDFNNRRYKEDGKIDLLMEDFLSEYEEKYGVLKRNTDFSGRFATLIRTASEKTGKGVIILVDEYDKPLVNNLLDKDRFHNLRNTLSEIYSNFKSSADYIRLVFLTGVTRFGKLSVFSDLNNISDISMLDQYAGICGITEEELIENFQEGIHRLAKKRNSTPHDTLAELKRRYDGYRFAEYSPEIYNPYSILNVFNNNKYGNYWIESGTPTLLLEQLKRTHADIAKVMDARAGETYLSGLDIDNISPVPLFYQTGYLTLKHYNERGRFYQLCIPNEEVEEGFYSFILPAYANLRQQTVEALVFDFLSEFEEGRPDLFMPRLQSLFSGTSYEMRLDDENNVQNVLYTLFMLIGLKIDVEFKTSDGRIDILLRTPEYIYIMELKYDRTAEEALRQIEEKRYDMPWNADKREIIAIGINYCKQKRTIESWISKTLSNEVV